jgi:hypothetical protein
MPPLLIDDAVDRLLRFEAAKKTKKRYGYTNLISIRQFIFFSIPIENEFALNIFTFLAFSP